jgi:hypothetical protein
MDVAVAIYTSVRHEFSASHGAWSEMLARLDESMLALKVLVQMRAHAAHLLFFSDAITLHMQCGQWQTPKQARK